PRPTEPRLQRIQRRHFLAARDAPRSPQIEQDGASMPVGKRPGHPGRVLENEVRNAARLVRGGDRRHLAVNERGDVPRRLRARAASHRGLALKASDPVYRREPRGGTDERHERNPGDSGRAPRFGLGPDRHQRRYLRGEAMSDISNKMWGGRFGSSPAAIMEEI